ncbi:hypothetical protein YPPY36_5032, partial [Yersinia pestis PY-36]
MALADASAAA